MGKLILSLLIVVGFECGANVIDRTFPAGTEISYIAFRSAANGLLLAVQADGTIRPTAVDATPASMFILVRQAATTFSLVSASTGGYVFVSPQSGSLYAFGAGIDGWSSFYSIDLDSGSSLGLQSAANGLYITAESGGASPLIANRYAIGGWETFSMLPVFDMATTISAFGTYHPNEAKQRTNLSYAGPLGDNAGILYDRVLPGGYQMVTTHVEADGTHIFDWMYMDGNQVGLHGAFTFCNGCAQSTFDTVIPYAKRFVTADMAGAQACGAFHTWNSVYPTAPVNDAGESTPHCNDIYYIGMADLGGNIGQRWVIAMGTDPGTWPGAAIELVYFDLGPSVGVWAPRYGYVQYVQVDRPKGVSLVETYGTLIPYEDHQTVYNYFSY